MSCLVQWHELGSSWSFTFVLYALYLTTYVNATYDFWIFFYLYQDHAGHIFGVNTMPMIQKLEQYNSIVEVSSMKLYLLQSSPDHFYIYESKPYFWMDNLTCSRPKRQNWLFGFFVRNMCSENRNLRGAKGVVQPPPMY